MKRLRRSVLALLVAVGVTATAAFAIVEHTAGSITDVGGFTAHLTGEYGGLGNSDLRGTIAFSGDVRYTCQNNGGNTAPGQPTHIDQQGSQDASANPKNGRATIDFTLSFSPPATVPGKDIGCPSGKWTGINPVVVGPVTATGTISWLTKPTAQTVFGPTTITLSP